MHHTLPLDWWINNVAMVRFPPVWHAHYLSGSFTLALSPPFTFFLFVSRLCLSLQMNSTPKFPSWRKASAAAAAHVTAFFSPWQCCSCPPCSCPSDCHGVWHFPRSWAALSEGLCVRLYRLKLFDVKVSRELRGESSRGNDGAAIEGTRKNKIPWT